MKYELIMLDADDTLFDFSKCEDEALCGIYDYYDLQCGKQCFYEQYRSINVLLWRELEKGLISTKEIRVERFRRLFDKLKLNDLDYMEFSNTYLGFLAKPVHMIEGAEELLEKLYGKARLAVITNGIKKVQRDRIGNSPVARYIENIIVSEEAGCAKPAAGIFEYAFKVMKHKDKSTVLMIGDSINTDIKGGADFGIDTCWYNPLELKSDISPTYSVKKMTDITNLLELPE